MSKVDLYISRLRSANSTQAFAIQGELFTDYLLDNIDYRSYCVLYSWCESIMSRSLVKCPIV